MSKGRILYLDIARVIAMLWIVCYWHVKDYVEVGETHAALILYGDEYVTDIMLGVFMFLSGFFMAKYRFDNFVENSKAYYAKRLTRFYLLYAVSAVLLFLIGFNPEIQTLITTLTVTSTYILPQPRTLWFLSMLASFYIFTPLLLKNGRKLLIIISLLLFSGGVILHLFLPNGIDTRFFWCFPLYSVGLYIGRDKSIMSLITKDVVGVLSIVITVVIVVYLQNAMGTKGWVYYLMFPFGIISVIYVSKYLSKLPIRPVVETIAYCSMCAYIFHRVFYSVLKKVIYGIIGYDFSYLFCFVVFIPICLVGSYLIQYHYDRYILPKLICNKKES